jgi:hypothetical protein
MVDTQIHILTREDLAADPRWDRWNDPDDIARIAPVKLKALLDNPFVGEGDDPIQLLGTLDNRVIGRLDVVAGALEIPGEQVRCLWGSGLYVPKEFRTTLMGVKLILTLQRLHHTVGASGVGRKVYPIYRDLRWRDFELPRYVLVRHSRALVEHYFGDGAVGAGARAVADLGLRAHGVLTSAQVRRLARRFVVQQLQEFPHALTQKPYAFDRPVSGNRGASWMNWLLRSQFDEGQLQRGLFAVLSPKDEILGYFVIRARKYEEVTQRSIRNIHLGSLQDWATFDATLRFQHVALLAVRELARWNVDAIEVFVPGDESSTGLGRLGFVRVGSMYVLVNASKESPLSSPQFATPNAWRVRPNEGESFFF